MRKELVAGDGLQAYLIAGLNGDGRRMLRVEKRKRCTPEQPPPARRGSRIDAGVLSGDREGSGGNAGSRSGKTGESQCWWKPAQVGESGHEPEEECAERKAAEVLDEGVSRKAQERCSGLQIGGMRGVEAHRNVDLTNGARIEEILLEQCEQVILDGVVRGFEWMKTHQKAGLTRRQTPLPGSRMGQQTLRERKNPPLHDTRVAGSKAQ